MADWMDSVSGAASSAWDTVSNWVSGPPAETGPITVPVTAQDEENARSMNAQADLANGRAAQDKCYEQKAGMYDYDPNNPYENYCD